MTMWLFCCIALNLIIDKKKKRFLNKFLSIYKWVLLCFQFRNNAIGYRKQLFFSIKKDKEEMIFAAEMDR